jgi:ABC-type Fe3+ transport system permease subunit
VFLTNSRTTTLPVEAYSYIRDFDDPTVAAMVALLMALSVVRWSTRWWGSTASWSCDEGLPLLGPYRLRVSGAGLNGALSTSL